MFSASAPPGTKLGAGKFSWGCGWMDGDCWKNSWKEQRRETEMGRGEMPLGSGWWNLTQAGIGWCGKPLKNCHLQSKNLTPWFHKKGLSLSQKWFDLTIRPDTCRLPCSETLSLGSWWLVTMGPFGEKWVLGGVQRVPTRPPSPLLFSFREFAVDVATLGLQQFYPIFKKSSK